ncbi:unnamed protein product [Boreogadus saida]
MDSDRCDQTPRARWFALKDSLFGLKTCHCMLHPSLVDRVTRSPADDALMRHTCAPLVETEGASAGEQEAMKQPQHEPPPEGVLKGWVLGHRRRDGGATPVLMFWPAPAPASRPGHRRHRLASSCVAGAGAGMSAILGVLLLYGGAGGG